ncbi:MAG: hypothetical protein A3D92_10130 [Bacteroidetes bacterium RIFCSPHIGHO2_02_FULL_44_7]|nr:MAG: hypothetical protein A3D92_10130 [Bacteroidetes bacterium RIFCSPHIGHO2_02_FULL_44_7]
MTRILTLLAFINIFIQPSFSQTQGIAYTAVGKGVATTFLTDYHCLGVNSSGLGWGNGYNKKFTMGMSEFSLGLYSDNLDKEKLSKLYKTIRSDVFGSGSSKADWQQQAAYAQDYLDAGIMFDARYNWLGFSFQTEKFGGIAFSVQEHYNWYSKLNTNTTGLVFQGKLSDYFTQFTAVFGSDTTIVQNDHDIAADTLAAVVAGTISTPLNLSQITNGSEVHFAWNRYYNFGYGKKLFGDSSFAISAGIGGRFIQSMAMFNMKSDADGLVFYSSLSPSFGIDYGAVANVNPSTFTKTGGIPAAVGNGYGIDLSVSAMIAGHVKLAVAVNNVGSVTYDRNVYRVRDTLVGEVSLNGMDNYNITNSVKQFLTEGGMVRLEGQEKIKINNPATIHIGGSYDFGIATVGVDFVAPFNRENPGGINNFVYSVGGEIRPRPWIQISAGYLGGGIYQHNVPIGINFVLGKGTYEFGIASRDALSFFLKNAHSVSTAFGVARFRF